VSREPDGRWTAVSRLTVNRAQPSLRRSPVAPVLEPVSHVLASVAHVFTSIAHVLTTIPDVLAAIADVLQAVASSAVVQCVTHVFALVADVLAAVPRVFASIADVFTSIANVLTPVAAILESVTDLAALHVRVERPSGRRVDVLRPRDGRGASHQSRGDRGDSEIAHHIPQGQDPRAPSWRALLVRRSLPQGR